MQKGSQCRFSTRKVVPLSLLCFLWLLATLINVEGSYASCLTSSSSLPSPFQRMATLASSKSLSRKKPSVFATAARQSNPASASAYSSSSPSSFGKKQESQLQSPMKLSPNGVPVLGNIALQPEYSGLPGEIQGLIFKSLGAYANSGAFGYVIGAVSAMTKPRIRQVLGLRGIHGAGFKQGKMWGEFCATFTFMENAVRILRKGEQDKWNSIAGGALSGLYMSRDKPPQVMLQTAATYGGINYLFQSFSPPKNEDQEQDGNQQTSGSKKTSSKYGNNQNLPSKEKGNKRKRLVIRYE